MLLRLYIQNVALVERAEVEFAEGLNVLSGETGAGKSVILDSIDFVLGAKADKSMVRYGAEECLVRAEFLVAGNERVREALAELDLDEEDTLILSRRLSKDGRSVLKINGASVTASMLRRVSASLVDVHGQSEHFFLLKESNQLRLLDALSPEIAQKKERVLALLSERKRILAEREKFGGDEGERSRRADILRYQIDELERASLAEGEEERLTALRDRFTNAEKILEGLSLARETLLSDGGGADCVNGAKRALASLARYDSRYRELAERLEAVYDELSDVGETAEGLLDELDVDEAEAERVENRLDEIKTIKKKYGGSVAEALAFLERAKQELALLADSGARYEELTALLEKTQRDLFAACVALTKARKAAAEGFTERVRAELRTLNIASAEFVVLFDEYTFDDVARAGEQGLDHVRFLFSANAGQPPKELSKIISGGEMSRFMLAVKAQLSSVNEIGTYLFDEIDAGIGGKTARVVAEKFCKISRAVQVIAVSHLAQIAAFADREFLIEKTETGGETFSGIRVVEGEARIGELARLIGDETGDYARKHAQKLLEDAAAYKNSLS